MIPTQTMHLFFPRNPSKFTHRFVALLILVDPLSPPKKKWQFMGILTISLKDFSASVSGISDFFQQTFRIGMDGQPRYTNDTQLEGKMPRILLNTATSAEGKEAKPSLGCPRKLVNG